MADRTDHVREGIEAEVGKAEHAVERVSELLDEDDLSAAEVLSILREDLGTARAVLETYDRRHHRL